MSGFQNQNLFKLPYEKKYRKKMMAAREPLIVDTDQIDTDCKVKFRIDLELAKFLNIDEWSTFKDYKGIDKKNPEH